MSPKRTLLFSASLLLLACLSVQAQQQQAVPATPVTPSAPTIDVETPFSFDFAAQGGNYLGVTTTEVTRENMGRYNMREPRGMAVTRVAEDSPAARAGLKAGDVILRFDNEPVTTHNKLQRLISEAAPEQSVRLAISRNGAEQEVTVTIGRRKSGYQSIFESYPTQQQGAEQARRALEDFRNQGAVGFFASRRIGINTTSLTKQLADYFGVTGGHGLLVTSVGENSPAARAGLKAGDVIVEADGEKVESSGDLSRTINRKNEGSVNLRIIRDRNSMNVTVTPEKREAGALTVSPEALGVQLEPLKIELPTIDIGVGKIKPITVRPITLPRIKISPKQLEQLRKLEGLKPEGLNLEDLMEL
ncbi:MAG TPA: PDZ domain-containing protein [Pyrinomonadaceae bacterium]|jgi:membrane-associated protease RseP (regulator of RpoE activity)